MNFAVPRLSVRPALLLHPVRRATFQLSLLQEPPLSPSARTSKPISGCNSSKVCCCPLITSWSPLPCPPSCAPSPAVSSGPSTTCSFAPPHKPYCNWPRTRASSARVSAWSDVLHTWTRQLLYHPHVHYLVTRRRPHCRPSLARGALRLSRARQSALPESFAPSFAMPSSRRNSLLKYRPARWRTDWVVHSEPVGSGAQAFQYLAPYIFRVALSNNRLRQLHHGQLTFSYKDSATDQLQELHPSPRESSSAASYNTSCRRASSRSVTTVCSAPVIGHCCSKRDNFSPLPPIN